MRRGPRRRLQRKAERPGELPHAFGRPLRRPPEGWCWLSWPDLEEAVTALTREAAGLRPEDLARLTRELSGQGRPPKDTDDLDQRRRDGLGLWFGAPNAAGMVAMTVAQQFYGPDIGEG